MRAVLAEVQNIGSHNNYATVLEKIAEIEERVADLQTQQVYLEREVERNTGERNGAEALVYLNRNAKVGTTYTRWGRKSCPGNDSVTVYKGMAAGSYYDHYGGATSMLCLPYEPEFGIFDDKIATYGGLIYGTEYLEDPRSTLIFPENNYQHDVPCAVCDVRRRTSQMMIPGRKSCYPGWTMEYWGYLMTGSYGQKGGKDYSCVDNSPESQFGGHEVKYGNLLYFVEARCGSLDCPPYVEGRELTCVVCTK